MVNGCTSSMMVHSHWSHRTNSGIQPLESQRHGTRTLGGIQPLEPQGHGTRPMLKCNKMDGCRAMPTHWHTMQFLC